MADAWMATGRCRNFHRNIAAGMSSWREKIRMHCNITCSPLDQPREPFGDIRMFDLQESRFDESKVSALADGPGCFPYIFVRFRATTAVTDDEDTTLDPVFHAATPDCCPIGKAQ